jgi:hypothetical protein
MLRARILIALAMASSASALHRGAPAQAMALPKRPALAPTAVKSNLALRGGGSLDATTLFKANSIFLGFFSLQFMLVPQFLMDTNFSEFAAGRKLDQFHLFIMRGFGVLGAGFCLLMNMVDADQWLGYMTAMMIMFCSALPFYAQAWLPVKLPEHYLPVGGCAALIAAHLYLWLPRAGLAFDAPSVVKAFVAFLGLFMIQFLVCPQFVYDMNFSDGKKLDEFHIFIMRGFGMLGLFFLGALAQLDADEFLPFITKWGCALTAIMPVYAHFNLPTKPEHVAAVGASLGLCGAMLSLLYK